MPSVPPKIDWSNSSLFIDVDGTLLHIEAHPDDVRADQQLIDRLEGIKRSLDGAFALVSGRPITELDRIFAPAQFTAIGAHGAEHRGADGQVHRESGAVLPDAVLEKVSGFVGTRQGLLVEIKNHGLALHYRNAPKLEQSCRALMQSVAGTLEEDFRLIEGKMVLELTAHGHNKGEAIRAMLGREPFAGRRPVFVGDDVTDEDGFREVNRQAGVSVKVGSTEATEARYVIEDVGSVHRWLLEIISTVDTG